MKKYLLIGIVGLLFLAGCGKNADIVCTQDVSESGMNMKATYYGYLTNDKVSKVEVEMVLEDESIAQLVCRMMGTDDEEAKVTCNGKKITMSYEGESEVTGISKAEFIQKVEAEGAKCK